MEEDFSCEQDTYEIRDKRELLINYLKKEGLTISAYAKNGWDCANKIIAYYDLVYTCPSDPGGWALLESAIKEYQERKVKENA